MYKGIVLYDFLLVRGGAERLTLTLLKDLPGVDLCIGFRDPHAFSEADIAGITTRDLGAETTLPVWRSLKVMRAFAHQTQFLNGYDWALFSGTHAPLAVHNHTSGQNYYYCHTLPRFVYDLKDYYLQRYPLALRPALLALIAYVKPRYEQAIARMDILIANSETVRNRLRRYLNRDAVVINPPCEIDYFQWQGQGDYYLSTARLEPFKRVDLLIKAFKQIPDQRLIITSGGSQFSALRRLAGGASNIIFTGWLGDAALCQLIGNAIATLYVAKDEDFGMSPVESMAAGKPVIGVAEGGLLETVLNGETGLLLPLDLTAEGITEAVRTLNASRALAMRSACELHARRFSRAIFLEKMRSILPANSLLTNP
ncbi:MAG: glycosyltransferase [Candidatus Competibacteraceae bacterium]|uniref:Glycosyl transferase group 1 n=2 Tax=Candidatus Contendibacter odensensis TaxID=1400860 RepID=A0A7U7J5H2_9GAMM|nr:glycosyltransferase [Candidatus Competibacteraceae bacterium]MBK8753883.1 glycosyltransferase [Candidatus Competibacteraceae bacterium]CDH46433.1 Glycosyl transferase group 1 [Candidatus Contendobacter odensis Run_B_J11]